MAITTPENMTKYLMDILRDKSGIGNMESIMDQSKKLFALGKNLSDRELESYSQAILPAIQAQTGTFVDRSINVSDYDLNALIAEQARLSLCKDVAQAKLNQAMQAANDAAFACDQHMNLIKAVVEATIENVKKVLK